MELFKENHSINRYLHRASGGIGVDLAAAQTKQRRLGKGSEPRLRRRSLTLQLSMHSFSKSCSIYFSIICLENSVEICLRAHVACLIYCSVSIVALRCHRFIKTALNQTFLSRLAQFLSIFSRM